MGKRLLELISRQAADGEALLDCGTGRSLSYGDLVDAARRAGAELARLQSRALVFLQATNTADYVILYLGCLEAGLPVLLVDPEAPMDLLVETYQPALILAPDPHAVAGYQEAGMLQAAPSYRAWRGGQAWPVHPDLAVLLPTSGSTGNPKLVRLQERNVVANAESIAEYLGLGPGERAIQSLPMYYSYGLSVLNSHLVSGGTVVLTTASFLRPEFWKQVDAHRCTSFAGIPYMYETLHRIRFNPGRYPSLRTLTQAGGGLKPELIAHFHQATTAAGMRFVVMYGQTEATARISYVPPERLADKIGTIGIAIPGGTLRLRPVPGLDGSCEMVYEGPNVMLGYAEKAEDLALGDVLQGVLVTGDLAVQDADGYFKLVGRLNRFAKLFGRRISLEDVERALEAEFKAPAAVVEADNALRVVVEAHGGGDPEAITHFVAKRLAVPPKAVLASLVEALPRTGNGKKNYSAIKA